jgi:lipopolysaccharide transport system permease protein
MNLQGPRDSTMPSIAAGTAPSASASITVDPDAVTGAGAPQTPVLRIRPRSGWSIINLREGWEFRDLLLSLAGRDVRLRYKQTLLGASWVVLQPLITAGIFALVFGRVANLSSGTVPYFLFSYCGLLAWNVFSSTLTKSSTSLVGNSQLISKIYFPRIILPLSTIPSALIDFGVALALLAVLFPMSKVGLHASVLLLPLWLVFVVLLASGAGLIAAALSVQYRDVQYIVPVLTQFLLYGSPVGYSMLSVIHRLSPKLLAVYYLNPLTGLLEAFRWSLLGPAGGELKWSLVAYSAGMSVVVFLMGTFVFRAMEDKFADVI